MNIYIYIYEHIFTYIYIYIYNKLLGNERLQPCRAIQESGTTASGGFYSRRSVNARVSFIRICWLNRKIMA